jgi:hypothetical protein
MQSTDYQTTKILKKTLRELRIVKALTGKDMVVIVDELVSKEFDRLKKLEKIMSTCVHGFTEGKCIHNTCINHN